MTRAGAVAGGTDLASLGLGPTVLRPLDDEHLPAPPRSERRAATAHQRRRDGVPAPRLAVSTALGRRARRAEQLVVPGAQQSPRLRIGPGSLVPVRDPLSDIGLRGLTARIPALPSGAAPPPKLT